MFRKIWKFIGIQENYNAIIIIVAVFTFIFALPYFSRQINNIQVDVNSINESIDALFNRYITESFCYNDIDKGKIILHKNEQILEIRLASTPMLNSVSIWEGAMNMSPLFFNVQDNVIKLNSNFGINELKEACTDDNFKIIVSYVSK